MDDKPISAQIDDIIKSHPGWKGEILSTIRRVVTSADPAIFEEIKWRAPSRPEGLAVWSMNGIICYAEIWKDNIKLIFQKGSKLPDPNRLFNARLKSSSVRAIELREGDSVDKAALKRLVQAAVKVNTSK